MLNKAFDARIWLAYIVYCVCTSQYIQKVRIEKETVYFWIAQDRTYKKDRTSKNSTNPAIKFSLHENVVCYNI